MQEQAVRPQIDRYRASYCGCRRFDKYAGVQGNGLALLAEIRGSDADDRNKDIRKRCLSVKITQHKRNLHIKFRPGV